MTHPPDHSESQSADDAAFLEPRIHALPKTIQPPHDLWPAISGRLAPRRRRQPTWFRANVWQLAAGIAIAVLSSTATAYFIRGSAGSGSRTDPSRASTVLETQLDKLHPTTRAALRQSLAIVDSAIAESRRALEQDPGNPALTELLQAVQQQRLELLRQATRLPRT